MSIHGKCKQSRRRFLSTLSYLSAGAMLAKPSFAKMRAPVMSWSDWAKYDALGIASLVQRGDVSALEIAEQVMHAVHLVDPKLNSVVQFYYDKLMPGGSDGLPKGLFHGVPFFFKDQGVVEKGRVSEFGSRAYANTVIEQNLPFINHIRQSGLNFLGRTATPELSNSILTESLQNGTTYNPWNSKYTPGGSSGGSAAAVASGILPMSCTSDGGGSTRLPASICGNVGLKHTRELANAISGVNDPLSFDSVGVNTRSMRDQAAFLDAALNPQRANANPGYDGSYLASIEATGLPLKIAMSTTQWGDYQAPDDAIAEMRRVAGVLRELGHSVEEADPKIDFRAFYKAFIIFWTAPKTSKFSPEEAKTIVNDETPDLVEAVNRMIQEDGRRWTWDDYQWALAVNREITHTATEFLSDWDLWLTPTLGAHTPRVGSETALWHENISIDDWWVNTFKIFPFTPLANFTGLPGISLPVAKFHSGMPLGMQFLGAPHTEAKLLQIGAQLERALPWFDSHPPTHVTNLG